MWMMISSTPAVAAALASSTTPVSLLRRSAMMPEPTTPGKQESGPDELAGQCSQSHGTTL